MAQSGYGKICLFDDFAGPEIPVANAVAYGTSAGGCNYYIGCFKVTGKLGETDAGVVSLAKSGGWVRLTGTNEADEGCAIGTEVCFSPALNGPLAVETRIETQALTARNLWVGFSGVNADSNVPPATGATTTVTYVDDDVIGFLYDSTFTDANDWHAVHQGGTAAAATVSTTVDMDEDAVAAQSQVLRVEIDVDGTARWYIDGKLKQTVSAAADPDELLCATIAAYGTTTTIADLDSDYLAVEANRDWTV